MRKLFFIILTIIGSLTSFKSHSMNDEVLNYKVTYKWGLINSQAGRATLSLSNNGAQYNALMVARTEPWADRIFPIRDTLISQMRITDLSPIRYDKIAHENGDFSHDIVKYSLNGDTYTGHCTRIRQKAKDKPRTQSSITLSAKGHTVDMLSVFYHLRSLDFKSMKQGDKVTMSIFSGKEKEKLDITFKGAKSITNDNIAYDTYHVSFVFTSHNGKKSSDDIDAWISADNRRIPIRIEGQLPIGKICCLYTTKKFD